MKWLRRLQKRLEPEIVHAHCDIPCGIYDPHLAQVAAHTVVRMVDLIHELDDKDDMSETDKQVNFSRYVAVKEEHGELCKHEVRIIWGDYFKEEHAKEFPELHGLVWKIMKLGGKARQTADKKVAQELLEAVNRFAEIFWKTKGKDAKAGTAAYPTDKPIVVPNLG